MFSMNSFVGHVDGHHVDFNTFPPQPAAGEQAIPAALDRGDPEWDSKPGWPQAASGWLILFFFLQWNVRKLALFSSSNL